MSRPGPIPKVDWDADPLFGKVSDAELARLRGCSRQNVSAARKARGIGRWNEPHGQALDESILRALANRFEPKSFSEIYFAVLNDYGGVTERAVKQKLVRMVESGQIDVTWDTHYVIHTR